MKRLRRFSACFGLLLLLFAVSTPAFAHANLVRSEPAANSAQKVSPTQVRLWFSEEVEPSFSSVSVLNQTGGAVDKGDSHRMSDDPKGMEVSVNPLDQGLYTVVWKSTSAVDGHVTNGSFSFTVGDVPLTESSPRELMSLVDAALGADAPPPLYQVIIRWLNILTLALLVGSFTFPLIVLLPALRLEGARSLVQDYVTLPRDWTQPLAESAWPSRWLSAARFFWVLLVLATLALAVSQALTVGGLGSLAQVIIGTRFGMIWLFRVVLLAIIGHLVFRLPWKSYRMFLIASALGLVLLFTQSLNSHDAALDNPPVLPLLTDWVHLLGVTVWVGGLVQLLLLLPPLLDSRPAGEQPRTLTSLISCFSAVAFITVVVIIVTGAYSMYLQVGSLEALFGTLYGTALLVKFLLILPLLALGALNLIVTRPAAALFAVNRIRILTRRFDIAVALEVLFAAGILLAVGVMTSVAPATSAYNPNQKLRIQTQRADDLVVTLGVAPALVGTNDFDIKLRDLSGQPITNATVVRLVATMREMDMGTQEVAATNQGNGHYTLHGDVMSMMGTWQLQVLVRRQGVTDAHAAFTVLALASPLPPQPSLLVSSTDAQVGLGLTLFAFAIGTASALFLKKKAVRRASLGGALTVAVIGAFAVYQTAATAPAGPVVVIPVVPGFARFVRPPIPPVPANIAAGQQIFMQNCATCHGTTGHGDGPAAANLNPKPFDLTVHAPLHTEGELYYWVTNGITGTAMPVWQDKLTDLQRWQVVLFVKTLGTATPTPPATGSNAPKGLVLVGDLAPDLKVSLTISSDSAGAAVYDALFTTANKQPVADIQSPALEFTSLDANGETQIAKLVPGADGHYRVMGSYAAQPGLWQIRVSAKRGAQDVSTEFPYLQPSNPNPASDPQAVALLQQSDAQMNALYSVRASEVLNDGVNGSVTTQYEYQAPDRLHYRVGGGIESIAIGKTQYYLEQAAWTDRDRIDPFVFPNFDAVKGAQAIRLGRSEVVDGIPMQIVELVLPSGDEKVHFAYWIGRDDHLVHRYVMVAPGHYMMRYYSDYNAPLDIQPPQVP